MAYASGIGILRMAYEAIGRGDAPALAAPLPHAVIGILDAAARAFAA